MVIDEARQATGLGDAGDGWFLGPLGAWVADLTQPILNDFGRRFLRSLAVRDVARRLRVLDVLRRHPEIAEVPVPPIVYITGLERSGSTMFHNVLARHRAARAFLRWELMEPVPPPEGVTHRTDPRIGAVQAAQDKLRGSLIERMHWVNAQEPEECAWGFIDAVGMLGQAPALCMPGWNRFLGEEDLRPAFEHYRLVVQLLLWKNPVGPDGFLVLKAPQIALHIAAFADVFPEARFVVTDRDPYRCIVSTAFMGQGIVEPFCAENPVTDDGRRNRIVFHRMRNKLAAVARFSAAQPERVIHVAYPAVVSDPADSAQRLFADMGVPSDETLAGRVNDYLAAQRAGARAVPPSELPTMGYGHDDVRSDPVLVAYCSTFHVEPERLRLTGAAADGLIAPR